MEGETRCFGSRDVEFESVGPLGGGPRCTGKVNLMLGWWGGQSLKKLWSLSSQMSHFPSGGQMTNKGLCVNQTSLINSETL